MLFRIFAMLSALVVIAGCASSESSRRFVDPYKPKNVYLREAKLPPELKRVAVLPLPRGDSNDAISAGRDVLTPILLAELNKCQLFEVVPITSAQMQMWTGRESWSMQETLPADFFKKLTKAVSCDAVVFAELTSYRPYPPLLVGLRMRLLDCEARNVWWSVDEVFDAGNERVAAGAEAYGRSLMVQPSPLLENSGMLDSPRRFGQYAAFTVFKTLPVR